MSFGSMFRWPGWISHHRPLYDGCDLSQEDSMASGASLQDRVQDGRVLGYGDREFTPRCYFEIYRSTSIYNLG